jgi:hypothetical protein
MRNRLLRAYSGALVMSAAELAGRATELCPSYYHDWRMIAQSCLAMYRVPEPEYLAWVGIGFST